MSVTLDMEPFHAFCCRQRQASIIRRHDDINLAFRRSMNRIPGVRASDAEPNVGAGDQRRADTLVRLEASGTRFLVDIGVVCPATRAKVRAGSHRTPGLVGAAGRDVKLAKYADVDGYIPFVIETGGRVDSVGLEFLDRIEGEVRQARDPDANISVVGTVIRDMSMVLALCQGRMLVGLVAQIANRAARRGVVADEFVDGDGDDVAEVGPLDELEGLDLEY